MEAPKTQYAKRGEINIAYQVVGEGPIDLVMVNGLASHLDLLWADPQATAMVRAMSSFARLILFDKPGTGLSDPVAGAPTLEQRTEDVRAVMDTAGSERAALLGYSEGGFPAARLAALHPDRVQALILLSTLARIADTPDPDYLPELEHVRQRMWREIEELAIKRWGEGDFALLLAPSWSRSTKPLAAFAERACASPGMVKAIVDSMRSYDMRSILPTIQVPTLVLHPREEWVPVEMGRDLAERIPGAKLVELPGRDHVIFAGDWRPMVAELEEFLTGRSAAVEPDRALRTVLFTDIARSTERASKLGDARWRDLLERHDRIVRDELSRFGGQEVKQLGDGFLAAFEGAARAVRCARQIAAAAAELGIEVRAGLHCGECEIRDEDLGGLAVHIGARIAALAEPSEVLVSGTVCDLVIGSGIEFTERGAHELKGVPGSWRLYAATGDQPAEARPVAHADHEAAALTPGPRETMKPIDRIAVRVARHAPGLARTGIRRMRRRRRSRR